MITSEQVRVAEDNIASVQSALDAVQVGLGAVEMVADAADEARRAWRTVFKVVVVIAVIAAIAGFVRSRKSADTDAA